MIRFAHVNLIARDWKKLALFYKEVLGCIPIYPERDLSGEWLDQATGVQNAHIRGIHLRLPGYADPAPTLEIFAYDRMPARPAISPNTPGFSHIALAVDNVREMSAKVIQHGGSAVGVLTEIDVEQVGSLIFQYVADPEGNILELQSWIIDHSADDESQSG